MKSKFFFDLGKCFSKFDLERAEDLFCTSVQDMQSGLWAYETFEDLKVLDLVRLLSVEYGEKTREQVVSRQINKILREAGLRVRRDMLP